MPVLENIHVQLSEVLEVRGAPLAEYEVWAVLCLSLDSIQDLFLRGAAFKDGFPVCLPTPDTLECTASGRILISPVTLENVNRIFWAPELLNNNLGNLEDNIGKVFVYSLAKTVQYALEMHTDISLRADWFSPFLNQTLLLMGKEDSTLRISLSELAKICTQYVGKESTELPLTTVIAQLHQEVLGSLPEADILGQVDKDFQEENAKMSFCDGNNEEFKYESTQVPFNLNESGRLYGHRLAYRGKDNTPKSVETKTDARERWKRAFVQIAHNRKQQSLDCLNMNCSSVLDNYKTQPSASKIYQELAERRRMVELLRMNIDTGQSAVKVNDKGLKPKTLAELVLLLKNNPSKAEPIMPSSNFSFSSLNRSKSSKNKLSSSDSGNETKDRFESPFYLKEKCASSSVEGFNKSLQVQCGPEFILNKAVHMVPLDLCSKRRLQNGSPSGFPCKVTVILLTGQLLQVTCDSNMSGRTLFHAVAHHIILQEHYLFGLAVNKDDEFMFLDGRQRLYKSFTSLVSDAKADNLTLYLRIKYFLTDHNLIKNQSTRHLYYLQERQDILTERLRCKMESVTTLSGLALQAEFGDQNSEEYFLLEHYITESCLRRCGSTDATANLMRKHSQNAGISADLAELQFIKGVCELPEYGYHFHKVLQDKHNLNSIVWLGICSQGIDIFEEKVEERQKTQSYLWADIQKLSFTKKSFNITPKSVSLTGRSVKYTFHTSGILKSRYLFNMCVGHHQFFVKLKSGANASEIIMEDLDLESGLSRSAQPDSLTSTDTDGEVECSLDSAGRNTSTWLASVHTRYLEGLQKIQELGSVRSRFTDFHELMERCSPSARSSSPFGSFAKRFSEGDRQNTFGSLGRKRTPVDSSPVKMVIKPLPLTAYQRKVLSGAVDPSRPQDLNSSIDFISATHTDTRISEVSQHNVRLQKDPDNGFGLVLTCGSTPDTVIAGTYIESLRPTRRAAYVDIQPGDRVISLNGQNVENKNYLEVAEHLQSLSGWAVLGLQRHKAANTGSTTDDDQLEHTQDPCSFDSSLQSSRSLDESSSASNLTPESDVIMDALFYNEDDPGPPKPHPRRKRSQKSWDQTCHSPDEKDGRGQEDVSTSAPDDDSARCTANEPSALNGKCPQVSSTCASSNSEEGGGSPADESESTHISNRLCDRTSPNEEEPNLLAPPPLDFASTGWSQGSLLELIPSTRSNVSSVRNCLYSWNLNRPSATPTYGEDWGEETEPVCDDLNAECGVEKNEQGGDDVGGGTSCAYDAQTVMDYFDREISSGETNKTRCDSVDEREECNANQDEDSPRQEPNASEEQVSITRFTVSLTKQEGSFGFRVTERYQFGEEYVRGVFVHSLIPDGAAERNGTIESGDKLVKINGSRTEVLSYQESVALLKKCPATCKLQFERRRPLPPQPLEEDEEEELELNMIAKWGRRGSRTSLSGADQHQADNGKPFYGRSVSQNCLSPVYLPNYCGEEQRKRSGSLGNENLSLPRVLNGVIRTSENVADLSPELSSTFPRKSKSKSPSLCEDSLSDDVFHASSHPQYVRSESAPLLFVPSRNQRNCSSPSNSVQLGSVPEDKSLDNFNNVFSSMREADREQEEITMSATATKYSFGEGGSGRGHSSHGLGPINGDVLVVPGKGHFGSEVNGPDNNTDHPQPTVRKKRAGLLESPEDVSKYLTPSNTFDVYLQKTSRGLGLGIFGGSDLERLGPVCQLIRVRKLYPLQTALESGKLNVGDVILQVNGQSTLGLKHTEALELLRVAPTDVHLKIYRPDPSVMPPVTYYIKDVSPNSSFIISPPGSASNTLSRPKNTPVHEEYVTSLIKKEGSLGFSIFRHERVHEDDCHPTGIYIKALVREPAISHDRLSPGDRILKVNDVEISSMSHAEAISFLRSAPEMVSLRVFSNSDPLWPQCLEDDSSKPTKPLRKEAVALLTNRAKNKDGKTSPRRLRQRRNGSDSQSSGEDPAEVILGTSPNVLTVPNILLSNSSVQTDKERNSSDGPSEQGLSLVRNLRPKSLDGLSFNEKKQSNGSDRLDSDLPFQRQGSVLEPDLNELGTEGAGLLKWRGATLLTGTENASQSSGSVNLSEIGLCKKEFVSTPSPVPAPPQRIQSLPSEEDELVKRNGHVNGSKDHVPQVVKVYVELDRGWHGRLGFSLSDILPGEKANPLSNYTSPVVRAVHAGSIAQKDGRVRVGDRLVMVNGESMVDRPAAEVIDLLRKTRGKMRMDFLRVQHECDTTSQSSNCS